MAKPHISVIIHTLNEEKSIRNCLESVKWADEIVIIDMYSDDRTVDIAREYTDKIFFHERMGFADPARQFGLEKSSHEWVLVIDADELVPLKLKNRLISIMEEDSADIVSTPHNNYFFGHLMQTSGWGPLQDKHHRFFKKNFLIFPDKVHYTLIEDENARIFEIEDLEEGIIHFNYIDFEHFVDKMNRYTTIEAKNLYEEGKDIKFRFLIKQLFHEFKARYFNANGRKEGFRGFSLSLLMVMYKLLTYSKLKLMKENNSKNPRENVLKKYQNIADEVISEYLEKRNS